MRKLIAIVAILVAGQALAATCWMDTINHRVNWVSRPDVVEMDGVRYTGYVPDEMLAAGGWVQVTYDDCDLRDRAWGWAPSPWARKMTTEEIAARDAADAAAQAKDAPYVDVRPAVYVPRFKGSLTNVVGLSQAFVDDDTDEAVFADETGSPEHTQAEKQAQHDARKAARAAALAAVETAGKNGKVNDRLDAIEAWIKNHK